MGICGLDTEHCKEVQSIGMARIPSEKDTIAGRPDRGQNPCGQIMKELQASYHRRKNVSFLRTVDQASHVVFIEIKHDEWHWCSTSLTDWRPDSRHRKMWGKLNAIGHLKSGRSLSICPALTSGFSGNYVNILNNLSMHFTRPLFIYFFIYSKTGSGFRVWATDFNKQREKKTFFLFIWFSFSVYV